MYSATMEVSNLLSYDTPTGHQPKESQAAQQQDPQRSHHYPTRHALSSNGQPFADQTVETISVVQGHDADNHGVAIGCSHEPPNPTPKNVAFELLFEGVSNCRARLPMRVQIFPHDTTESIVTTVRNFYGLYEGTGKGVSFEDERGNILIAQYENFNNNMIVYVRATPDYAQTSQLNRHVTYHSASPTSAERTPHLDDAPQMLPQPAKAFSRPTSPISRKRSLSPGMAKSRRSASRSKVLSRAIPKSREASVHGGYDEIHSDAVNGYSSSDGGAGSVTSSRKTRSEQLASADISLDNILEGGRRKRAKFESSELPLFVPPQVPAANSISSVSPQRRSNGQDNPSPFTKPTQRTFIYSQQLQSPQSYGYSETSQGVNTAGSTPFTVPSTGRSSRLRDRVNPSHISTRSISGGFPKVQGFGILPTPDPTIASCISDEDVALQLMRLGDASNFSHGRTSASTLDDALSGRADVASSATSESGDDSETTEQPPLATTLTKAHSEPSTGVLSGDTTKNNKHLNSGLLDIKNPNCTGDELDRRSVSDFKKDEIPEQGINGSVDDPGPANKLEASGPKTNLAEGPNSRTSNARKAPKFSKQRQAGVSKKTKPSSLTTGFKHPISPASLTPQSRKPSLTSTLNFQHQLGADEEDLSSKPRCQRCRKSKKGCDRQRPCQRCQDAGIGIEGCISEDEGNGRKGRFGRHMGVSVKKEKHNIQSSNGFEDAGESLNSITANAEKSKKRKR